MTTKHKGRPALSQGERSGHIGARLPESAITKLEACVARANARAKKAGDPPSVTLSTLVRMVVLEWLAREPDVSPKPPRSAQDKVQGPRLTETKPALKGPLQGQGGPVDLTD